MVKKKFTDRRPKEYDSKSDVELIELLDTGTLSEWQRDSIKAILDKRTKKTIQYLTEVIQENSRKTSMHNWTLISLTVVIAILTYFMFVR